MAKVYLRAYNREIESMLDGGLFSEAVAHSLHILKTHPKHLETYRLLGKAYLELKQYADAADIFSRLLACVPNDFVAHVGMGIIRDEENKLDDAIWHMERAFETQPSNPAVQSELQRLYGRRDGSAPPRIRMTRGALAQMYLQGELYPQAISEIKGVLTEDPGRTDMQVQLARAHFRAGQKNEAAEVASSLLRRYPYCLEANRVLAEILGVDRPDSAIAYRQRVVELDPYAAHTAGSLFQASEAPDSAVALEKLDWNGQPVGMASDWREARGIGLPGDEAKDQQPDWLQAGYKEADTQPPTPLIPPVPAPRSTPGINDNIPDFMRKAGWQGSTGAFDESKSPFAAGDSEGLPPIAAGDLPDWVKEMAPAESRIPPVEKEDLPDWMNRIDPGILGGTAAAAAAADDQSDWLKSMDQAGFPAPSIQPADETPDWLKSLDQPGTGAVSEQTAGETPDWLKDLDQPGTGAPSVQPTEETPDWLKNLDAPVSQVQPAIALDDQSDWLKPADETPDWLKDLDVPVSPIQPAIVPDDQSDWLKPADETPDWLKDLDVPVSPIQPAIVPDDQADWLKPAGDAEEKQAATAFEIPEASVTEPKPMAEMPSTSEKDLDDSFAWLESLAAKQGATEGLLMKPEERLEQEPEWVRQAKDLTSEFVRTETPSMPLGEVPAVVEPPTQPRGELEALGKTEQEQDDSFSWLETLAAKQGATEGLLTKPEDRLQQEPDWVRQAKAIGEEEIPAPVEPLSSGADTAMWLRSLDQLDQDELAPTETASQQLTGDDTSMWLKGLDEMEAQTEPQGESTDETSAWLKSLDEPEAESAVPALGSDLPDWMQNLETQKTEPEAEPALPEPQVEAASDADGSTPEDQPLPRTDTGGLPSWLRGLDQGETQSTAQDDLPAWLRDDTGELVAEPVKIEPTRAEEWQPVDALEPSFPPHVEEPAPFVPVQEEKPKPAPKKKPAAKKPETTPEALTMSYREPVTRRAGGIAAPEEDPVLVMARTELTRSNIPGALDTYAKLIKRGRFLDEVIFDLREALYRYPVEVSIWQSLGDAYMRANRLQDALDSYTKAEELLR